MTTVQSGRYRHYKGNEYTVLGVARHSETLEELVVAQGPLTVEELVPVARLVGEALHAAHAF